MQGAHINVSDIVYLEPSAAAAAAAAAAAEEEEDEEEEAAFAFSLWALMQACASALRVGKRPGIYRGSSVAAWGLGLLVESIGAHMVRCLPCPFTSRAAMM